VRRQATLTVWSGLLSGLDLVMAPVLWVVAVYGAIRSNFQRDVITALTVIAGGSVLCGLLALLTGLLGAPRRLVLLIAALPPLALIALIVKLSLGGTQ
jgi:hypothetical protein